MSRRGWLLFSAMSVIWGIPYLFIKIALEGVSAPFLVFARTAIAASILLPIALRRGMIRPALHVWPHANVVAAVLTLGIVCTASAFLLFFALIAEIGAVRSTIITFINPAVAVVLGMVVLSEPFTVGVAVGFPLVLAGSWLSTRK